MLGQVIRSNLHLHTSFLHDVSREDISNCGSSYEIMELAFLSLYG